MKFFCLTVLLFMTINLANGSDSLFQVQPTILFSDFDLLPPKKTRDLGRYRSLGLKFGPRSVSANEGTIRTTYVDESPATDSFSGMKEVNSRYTSLGIQMEYNWRRYNGLNHSLSFDVGLGSVSSFLFGYSIGWAQTFEINDKLLVIRPALGLNLGNYLFNIGDLVNGTGYIQIGDNLYYDQKVSLVLASQFVAISPQVDVRLALVSNIHITFQIAYDLTSGNSDPELRVSSTTSDPSLSNTLEISGANPNLTYNGKKLTSLPFDGGGLRLSVGASYVWNRD